MSTRKLSDKELDRYFRNILKKPEAVPFDEAAWQGMSEKLAGAAAEKATLPIWLKGLGIVGAVILFVFLTFLFYPGGEVIDGAFTNASTEVVSESLESGSSILISDSLSTKEMKVNDTDESQKAVVAGSASTSVSVKAASEAARSETPNVVGASVSDPATRNTSSNNPGTEQISSEFVATKEAQPTEASPGTIINDSEEAAAKNAAQEGPIISDAAPSQAENPASVDEETPGLYEEDERPYMSDRSPLSSRNPALYLASSGQPTALDPLETAEEGVESAQDSSRHRSERNFINRFQIGLSLAPDLTTVEELSEFDRAGLDVGVHVEYFVTDRLSITTGAILTRKIYRTTDLTEYQVPNGFWSNGVWPDQINADCRVVDIPLNLRYRAIEGTRTSFFISAGISSYLMLSEIYEYEYAYNNQRPDNRNRSEFENENQHYFGVYNLSFGIVRKVGKNISIEVEPFLKNSLGPVGWGQTQLKSTGALFHLKYHLGTQ